jgi:uncharacterized membrane protein
MAAHEYYRSRKGGSEDSHPIDFDGDRPAYLEFFYTGLTVGMA